MQDATKMTFFKRMFGLSITLKEAGMSSIMRYNVAQTGPSEVKKNSHVKTRKKGGCWIWIKHRLAYISGWIGSIRAKTHVEANHSGSAVQKNSNCCTVNELQWIMTSVDVNTDNMSSAYWCAGWFLSFMAYSTFVVYFWT